MLEKEKKDPLKVNNNNDNDNGKGTMIFLYAE